MSTTDELLEEMLEDAEEYATPVTDDDLQFWINEHLRVISIPKNGVVAGVEGDKNVNKIKFGMNRYYHGFDMSTFSGRILYSNAKGNKNYYNITDMQASGSAITFSWLVDADAVQYMGKTAFVVYLFKIQGSELRQKFYSTLATVKVLEGMEVDSAVPVEKQTDIIERMKEEISAYAEEVKKSLPADYTAMTEQVNSLKEDLYKLVNETNYGIKSTLTYDEYLSGKKLNESGNFVSDNSYAILRFNVKNISIIRFDWLKHSDIGKAQFQDNNNRPSSGLNMNLLGKNFEIIEGKPIIVPKSAKYLFVSSLKEDSLSYYINELWDNSTVVPNVLRNGEIVSDGGKKFSNNVINQIISNLKLGDTITVSSNGLTHRLLIWENNPFGTKIHDTNYTKDTKIVRITTKKAVAIINFKKEDGSVIYPSEYTSNVSVVSDELGKIDKLIGSNRVYNNMLYTDGLTNITNALSFKKRSYGTNWDTGVGILEYYDDALDAYTTDPFNFKNDVVTLFIKPESGYVFFVDEFKKRDDGKYERNYIYPLFQNNDKEFKVRIRDEMYINLYPERYYIISVRTENYETIDDVKINDFVSIYKVDNTIHIPNYYVEHLNYCIDKINNNTNGFGDYSFAFITDIHCRHNTQHSPALLRELINKCAINTVIGGGDWNTAYNYTDMGIKALTNDFKTLRSYFNGIPMIKTVGNHEWAYGGFENPYNVSNEWVYDWYYRDDEANKNKPIIYGENGTYFYQDDLTNKVRYVSVNVMDYQSEYEPTENNKIFKFFVSQTQIKWLKEKAFYLPDDDWQIIVFSHVPIWTDSDRPDWSSSYIDNAEELEQLVDDFFRKTNYATSYKGTLVCWISGHTHRDAMLRIKGGVMHIVTNGDCFLQATGSQDRIKGTISEQCFDVLSVNKSERKVYLTRVGAGSDREFNY